MNFDQLLAECGHGEKTQKLGNLRSWLKCYNDFLLKQLDIESIFVYDKNSELIKQKLVTELDILKENMKQSEWWILNADRLAEESRKQPMPKVLKTTEKKCCCKCKCQST